MDGQLLGINELIIDGEALPGFSQIMEEVRRLVRLPRGLIGETDLQIVRFVTNAIPYTSRYATKVGKNRMPWEKGKRMSVKHGIFKTSVLGEEEYASQLPGRRLYRAKETIMCDHLGIPRDELYKINRRLNAEFIIPSINRLIIPFGDEPMMEKQIQMINRMGLPIRGSMWGIGGVITTSGDEISVEEYNTLEINHLRGILRS